MVVLQALEGPEVGWGAHSTQFVGVAHQGWNMVLEEEEEEEGNWKGGSGDGGGEEDSGLHTLVILVDEEAKINGKGSSKIKTQM